MTDGGSFPRLRTWLTRAGNSPEAPKFLTRGLIISCQEATSPAVATRDACHHSVPEYKGCASCAIVLMPVGHLGIPDESAGKAIERNQMGIICSHEDEIAPGCRPSVFPAARSPADLTSILPAVMPDYMATPRIERVTFVGNRDIHNSAENGRSNLKFARIWNREHPLGLQFRNVGSVNLFQRAEAVPKSTAIVIGPVALGGHSSIDTCRGFAEKAQLMVVT